jgi:hypothetical protein
MLGLINFDSIIMIYKNWPSNARSYCYFFTKKDVNVFTQESNL